MFFIFIMLFSPFIVLHLEPPLFPLLRKEEIGRMLFLYLPLVPSFARRGLRRELSRTMKGVVFFLGYPRFHEDKFTTPLPPLLRGIFHHLCHIIRINKMKISILPS